MKKLIFLLSIIFFSNLNAKENLKFYINKAIENNYKLNAERKKLESVKQNKNISRSEFLNVKLKHFDILKEKKYTN